MASVTIQVIPLACSQGPNNLCYHLPWLVWQVCAAEKKDLQLPQLSPSLSAFPVSVFCTSPLSTLSVCPHDSLSVPCLSVCLFTCPFVCFYPFPRYSVLHGVTSQRCTLARPTKDTLLPHYIS